MKRAALFGLLALVPAALNASAPGGLTLIAPTCAGAVHAVTVPVNSDAPQRQNPTCCAKGCHTSRKRAGGAVRG